MAGNDRCTLHFTILTNSPPTHQPRSILPYFPKIFLYFTHVSFSAQQAHEASGGGPSRRTRARQAGRWWWHLRCQTQVLVSSSRVRRPGLRRQTAKATATQSPFLLALPLPASGCSVLAALLPIGLESATPSPAPLAPLPPLKVIDRSIHFRCSA